MALAMSQNETEQHSYMPLEYSILRSALDSVGVWIYYSDESYT